MTYNSLNRYRELTLVRTRVSTKGYTGVLRIEKEIAMTLCGHFEYY